MLISMSPCSRRCVRQARERPRTEQFEVRGLWGDCIRRHADGEAGPMTPDPADTSPRWRRQVPPERRVDHTPCNLFAARPDCFAAPPDPARPAPRLRRRAPRPADPRDCPAEGAEAAGHCPVAWPGAIAAMTSSSPWEWRGHYGVY